MASSQRWLPPTLFCRDCGLLNDDQPLDHAPHVHSVGVGGNVDEAPFAGASAFLLGTVLEQVFARLASMNTFTELVLVSERRGEIKRWPPRMAARQLV